MKGSQNGVSYDSSDRQKQGKREGFSSGVAVFFATLGSAVGLGNIWKFPYLTGANGGAAFLFIYLICVIFVGIPVMVCEFYIGRKTRKNIMGAIEELKPKSAWKSIGIFGVITAYLILFFYSDVGGWVYLYVFKAIKGDFVGVTAESAGAQIGNAVVGPVSPLMWQIIVVAVVSFILILGVEKGIERVTKTLLPVLFVLIIVCAVRGLTLSGASQGLAFLFKPDFSKITPAVILAALGLAFFKLSLGMGTMATYASYFTKEDNLLATSMRVAISDVIVSLLAGMAIFPTVFTFNMKPEAGSTLLFTTIPLVFSKIPFGNILLVAFFFLASIAATTAMISMFEVLVAYFSEERGLTRTKAVLINAVIIIIVGSLATLSAAPSSILGNVKIAGKGFFDLFDYISSNILMPIGGFLTVLLVGHFIRKEDVKRELSNNGTLSNSGIIGIFMFIVKYISPLLLIIVFLSSIGILKL